MTLGDKNCKFLAVKSYFGFYYSKKDFVTPMFIFFKDFIYSFMRDMERGRDIGRGRSRLLAGILMWDLIPGLQDHSLGQRQAPNR